MSERNTIDIQQGLDTVTKKLLALSPQQRLKYVLRLCIWYRELACTYIKYGFERDGGDDEFELALEISYWWHAPRTERDIMWEIHVAA